jgi:CheY-like chemotaxis protein
MMFNLPSMRDSFLSGIQIYFASNVPKISPLFAGQKDDRSPSTHSPRILIVEDEAFVAMHLESVLTALEFEVSGIAGTGEKAIDEVLAHDIDLILMDVNLGSGIDGIETARRIRELADIPVIFVTAYTNEGAIKRIKAAVGDAPIISKPISADKLQSAVRKIY